MPILIRAFVVWLAATVACLSQTQKFTTHHALTDPGVPPGLKLDATTKDWAGAEKGPVPGLREFAREKSGAVWLGSDDGAARFDPKAAHRWDRWQYFCGQRWLKDNAG